MFKTRSRVLEKGREIRWSQRQASLRAVEVSLRTSSREGKLEGHNSGKRRWTGPKRGGNKGEITSHVFLAFKDDKCVASVWLFLLVSFFGGVRIDDNASLWKYVSIRSTISAAEVEKDIHAQ